MAVLKLLMFRLFYPILLTALTAHQSYSANTTVVTRLFRELLNNTKYEPAVRPTNDSDFPLVVECAFVPILHHVDLVNQEIELRGRMVMTWVDDRLAWNPEDYEGVNRLQVPVAEIWISDLTIYERISTNSDQSFQTETNVATISYTGEIQWDTMATSRSFCLMDVTYFPYDKHKCYISFTTLEYLKTEVQLKQNKAILGNYTYKDYEVHNAEWDMGFTENDPDKPDYVECDYCLSDYSNISYIVSLKRLNPVDAILTFAVPCLFLACVSSCIVCFPRKSEEAPAFGLACSLALTVFLMALYNMLPGTGFCKLGQLIVYLLYVVTMETMCASISLSLFRNGVKKRDAESEDRFRGDATEMQPLTSSRFAQTGYESLGQTGQRSNDIPSTSDTSSETNVPTHDDTVTSNLTGETCISTIFTKLRVYLLRWFLEILFSFLGVLKLILTLHFFIVTKSAH